MENTPDVADFSILAWILKNKIVTEKGEPLDFHDRRFLLDILTDWSQEIVWKKCSQVGGSVIFNIKSFFALMKLGWNIIYTMPSDSDVEDFVKTKTNPLLIANHHVFSGVSQDSIYLKQMGERFLHFKGTISKTAAISTSSDLNIHDEASRSDQATLETYKSRIKASKFKGRWFFSNPTTEKDLLDEKWLKSDQKEWAVTCANGHAEVMAWPESVDKERACFQCKTCHVELTDEQRRMGKWVAQRPNADISGYHTSHLMAPWITAKEIIEDSEGDQEYFYNFVLGEPYNPGDLKVSRGTILDNWTPRDLQTGTWYLGVDVGNIKHYALGSEKGLTKIGRFSKWSDLDDMMRFYKPALVIDAMPDNTMSKYFVDTYENAMMSFFQENANNPQTVVWWGQNSGPLDGQGQRKGIVYSNRHRVIDQLINEILNARILFGVSSDKDFKDYIRHWETLRRVKVTNAKGIERYEWESTTGEDHYVFATLYYYLATLGRGSGEFFKEATNELPEFIKDGVVGDIAEVIERANNW